MTEQLAKAEQKEKETLADILNNALPELRNIAPKYVNITRLISLAIEVKMRNPLLASCSPVSVLNFCKKCAETGTDRVGAGGMWAVPFWNSKTGAYDMTPIPDWRLLVEKAKKAKAIRHAYAEAVYEKDHFVYERGLDPILSHVPAPGSDRGKLVACYAVYTLPDGVKDFTVMDWEADIIPIRNRTNAWKAWLERKASNPWVTDEAEQGKKTVIKRAMKLFEGASIELTALLDADNVVNGYADISVPEPEPITMPRVIVGEVVGDQVAGEQTTVASESQAEPAQQTITGVIQAVTTKSGKGKKGDWTKYGVQVEGAWYGTFDANIGKVAQEQRGRLACLTWKQDGEYKTIVDIQVGEVLDPVPAGPEPQASNPVTDRIEAMKAIDPDLYKVITTQLNIIPLTVGGVMVVEKEFDKELAKRENPEG